MAGCLYLKEALFSSENARSHFDHSGSQTALVLRVKCPFHVLVSTHFLYFNPSCHSQPCFGNHGIIWAPHLCPTHSSHQSRLGWLPLCSVCGYVSDPGVLVWLSVLPNICLASCLLVLECFCDLPTLSLGVLPNSVRSAFLPSWHLLVSLLSVFIHWIISLLSDVGVAACLSCT